MVYPVLLVKVVQGFIVYDIVKPLNIKVIMDDNWDFEWDTHVKNYIADNAKYKPGDIVHTWIDGKCVSGIVRMRYLTGLNDGDVRYNIAVDNGSLINVREDMLYKTGHINTELPPSSILDYW